MKSEIFRKSSLERVASPEQLNDYIKVSNPSIWVIIAAMFVILGMFGTWLAIGNLPTTIKAKGVFLASTKGGAVDTIEGFLPESQISSEQTDQSNQQIVPVQKDNKVEITHAGSGEKLTGKVMEVSSTPVGPDELDKAIGNEWVAKQLQVSGYAFPVVIKLDKAGANIKANDVGAISITTESVKPSSFIFN
jgi:hypothetical protein